VNAIFPKITMSSIGNISSASLIISSLTVCTFIIDHFICPVRAVSLVCVCVCVWTVTSEQNDASRRYFAADLP